MNNVLTQYIRILLDRWHWVAGVMLVVLGAAAGALLSQTQTYTSTAAVFVSTPRDDADTYYRGDLYARERLPSFIALTHSEELANRVISNLGLPLDAATLISGTTATAVPDTVLIQIVTAGDSPQQAQQINNGFVEALTAKVHDLESIPGALTPRSELVEVEPSTLPTSPSGFPPTLILAAAAAAGLIGGCALAVILALLDTRVRTAGELAQAVGAETLVHLPQEGRSDDPREFYRVLRERLISKLPVLRDPLACQVILVTSAESNVGKTTVALGLARAIRDIGSRIALVDLDVRSSGLVSKTGFDAPVTITNIVLHQASPRDVEQNSFEGFTLVPMGATGPNPGQLIDSPQIPFLIDRLRSTYDWIIIDCAASEDYSDALRLARYTDTVLVVARRGESKFLPVQHVCDQFRDADLYITGGVLTGSSQFGRAPERDSRGERTRFRRSVPPRIVVGGPGSSFDGHLR